MSVEHSEQLTVHFHTTRSIYLGKIYLSIYLSTVNSITFKK